MIRRYSCLPEEIVTDGIYSLIAVQDRHIEAIRKWRNAQIDVLRQTTPITPEQQILYYAEHIWPSLDASHPKNILISFLEDGRHIGYGGLVHIAWEHRRAEMSFLLDTSLATSIPIYSKYFSAYLRLLKQLAFESLNFHKLCTETYAFREATLNILEENGFRQEGRLRDHVWIEGKPVDSLMHGCLHDEYLSDE